MTVWHIIILSRSLQWSVFYQVLVWMVLSQMVVLMYGVCSFSWQSG